MRTITVIAVMLICTPVFALMDYNDESNQQDQTMIGVNQNENENTNNNTNIATSDSTSQAQQGQLQGQGQLQDQDQQMQQGQQMGQGQIGEVTVDSHDEAVFIPAAATNPNVGQGGMAASSPLGGVAITNSEQGKLNMDNINTLIVLYENGVIDQETFVTEAKGQWGQMKDAAKPKLLLGILPIQGNPILDLVSWRFGWGNGKK